jgi:hypothetical protein
LDFFNRLFWCHTITKYRGITRYQDCALVLSQEALAERNEEKNIAELLVVSDEKADSDRGRKKKISGRSDEMFAKKGSDVGTT